MLSHSKEKVLNFLLLTHQWLQKAKQASEPSHKKLCQEVMVQEQTAMTAASSTYFNV